ncbi:hypothetical protein CYG49_04095 [Candidatus Saccharibacteria bacterium]|nr:MAG: hypothetical protein CYG49_04095 [Candidatus Saccharibacteria bacterium]
MAERPKPTVERLTAGRKRFVRACGKLALVSAVLSGCGADDDFQPRRPLDLRPTITATPSPSPTKEEMPTPTPSPVESETSASPFEEAPEDEQSIDENDDESYQSVTDCSGSELVEGGVPWRSVVVDGRCSEVPEEPVALYAQPFARAELIVGRVATGTVLPFECRMIDNPTTEEQETESVSNAETTSSIWVRVNTANVDVEDRVGGMDVMYIPGVDVQGAELVFSCS